MRPGRLRRAITLITLLSFIVVASGCYGGFTLTKALYKFNGEIKVDGSAAANRVAQSVVMVILVIVPVYQLAAIADAVILNSIEFWSGKNPMQADAEPSIRIVYRGNERYVQTFIHTAAGKEMRVEYYHEGRYMNTLVVRQEENSLAVTADLRWSDGRHETYRATSAGEEGYLLGHTNALGAQRQWVVGRSEVAPLLSAAARATATATLLF